MMNVNFSHHHKMSNVKTINAKQKSFYMHFTLAMQLSSFLSRNNENMFFFKPSTKWQLHSLAYSTYSCSALLRSVNKTYTFHTQLLTTKTV